MGKLYDFVKAQSGQTYHILDIKFWIDGDKPEIQMKMKYKKWYTHTNEDVLIDVAEDYGVGFRVCQECGKPAREIMMDEGGDFYCCQECFAEKYKPIWKDIEDDGCGGCFLDEEGNGTGVFYTDFL